MYGTNTTLVEIDNDDTTQWQPSLKIDSDGGGHALYIQQSRNARGIRVEHTGASEALDIVSANTTIDAVYINASSLTSGNYINTDCNARLTAGGVWTNSCDRDMKENFKDVTTLAKVRQLPVQEYTYKKERDAEITPKHLTPVAQDFF